MLNIEDNDLRSRNVQNISVLHNQVMLLNTRGPDILTCEKINSKIILRLNLLEQMQYLYISIVLPVYFIALAIHENFALQSDVIYYRSYKVWLGHENCGCQGSNLRKTQLVVTFDS
uniref:Uncharacterized protein n=1 Tax=Glossina brevipalpis TaxID=37001 RepID=A0A1A9WEC7_9MUSC